MKDLTWHNKAHKVIEDLLKKTLKKMFAKVDLHYDEWNINVVSFEKVKNSPKLKRLKKLSEEYDYLFEIAESFGVRKKINPNFIWFKNIIK